MAITQIFRYMLKLHLVVKPDLGTINLRRHFPLSSLSRC